MVIIYMLLHMAVDFPLQSPANTLLFLLALMLIAICDQRTKLGKNLSGENRHQSDEPQGY
jgi:hypothetical protein